MNKFKLRQFVMCLSLCCTTPLFAQINAERMLLIGRNALFYDDYALSIQYFNQVISAKPHLYEPYFYRGLAKFYLEDYNGADMDCSKSIELNPYFVNAFEVRGLSRINRNDYIGASRDYEEATLLDGTNKSVWHNLVLCYFETDSLERANKALETIISKWPKYADGYLLKAEVHLKQGDTIEAEMVVDKALDVERYSVQALSMKSGLLMHREEYEDAEKTLNEAIRLQPRNARNIVNRAMCRYQLNNFRGAMTDYDLAINIDPTNFVGHYNRGLLRASVGEDNKAIEDFNFILERDPNDVMTLFNRARLYDQTGDYNAAIRDYTTVIEEFPKFLYGYQLRAAARRKIGDVKGAMKDEEHILRENIAHHYGYSTPTSRQKNKTRKKSQVNLDDYQQMVEEDDDKLYADDFSGKIQNKPTDTKLLPLIVLTKDDNTASESVLNDYTIEAYGIPAEALAEFRQGIESCALADESRLNAIKQGSSPLTPPLPATNITYFAKATESFRHSIELAPQFAEAYYNLAYTLAMQGKYPDAITQLSHAIEKKKNFSLAYFNRGIINLFSGNKTQAFEDLSIAGELGIYKAYSIIKQNRKDNPQNKTDNNQQDK